MQCEFTFGLDEDIQARINKVFRDLEGYARLQIGIDLDRAAELYCKAHEVLSWARVEQANRNANKAKREAEAAKAKEVKRLQDEAKRAAEQRAMEAERRNTVAESILDLKKLAA